MPGTVVVEAVQVHKVSTGTNKLKEKGFSLVNAAGDRFFRVDAQN